MLSVGDLVNVIYPAGVPYYGIGESYIRRVMEDNPHTITTIYTEPNEYIGSDVAIWSCHIDGCHNNLFWPDFLLESVYINREPDWEV
jgi:hypothetical protein